LSAISIRHPRQSPTLASPVFTISMAVARDAAGLLQVRHLDAIVIDDALLTVDEVEVTPQSLASLEVSVR